LACGALPHTSASEAFGLAAEEFTRMLRDEWGVDEPVEWTQIKPDWWGADFVPGALAAVEDEAR
jgi:hypothetical protein